MRGKWLMVMTDPSACDETCAKKAVHDAPDPRRTGRDRERIVPVWLIQDRGDVDDRLAAAYNEPYAGVRFLRMDRATIAQWLPAQDGGRRGHDLPGRSAGQPDDALAEGPRPEEDEQRPQEAAQVFPHRLMH
jgi:hypothetical protein